MLLRVILFQAYQPFGLIDPKGVPHVFLLWLNAVVPYSGLRATTARASHFLE
jgi:hypothetical protein